MNYQNSIFKRDNLFIRNHLHNHLDNRLDNRLDNQIYSTCDHYFNKQCSRFSRTIERCTVYCNQTVCIQCTCKHSSRAYSTSCLGSYPRISSRCNSRCDSKCSSKCNSKCNSECNSKFSPKCNSKYNSRCHSKNSNKSSTITKFNNHHSFSNHFQKPSFYFLIFKFLSFLNWKFYNHKSKSTHRNLNLLPFVLIALLSFNKLTYAQHSTCPNAKQINDLKPLNVNLNCDCTQTADGQKAGWEIMCYSVENLNNGNSEPPANVAEKSTPSTIVDRTDNGNRNSEMVEEVTSDNLSLSNFGDERVENDSFFAERLSSGGENLEYVDELSLYHSVPIAFTIKYVANQLLSIECYSSMPNFKPAMFQNFKIDEIDAFKVLNCPLPDVPWNIIFHRSSATTQVPSLRSLKLETLHTQSIDLNQFRKLFVNLESLEILTIDNYELDTNGKGLRMKRQIAPFNRNMMSLVNNQFASNRFNQPIAPQQNITNSQAFLLNKMHRTNALNQALNNHPSINRFKSTPFNFVTPSVLSPNFNGNNQFEPNRLINVRAIHNNQKPPSFDLLTTMSSAPDNDHTSMIFKHFDAINPTTNSPISRFSNLVRGNGGVSRLPNLSTTNLGHYSSSFQPSSFQTNSPLFNYNKFTTPLPPISTSTTNRPITTTTTTTTGSIVVSSTQSNSKLNNSENSLLTSDSRLISNHLPNSNLPVNNSPAMISSTTNRPLNLMMMPNSSTLNDTYIGLENYNQPNRMKTPLLTNMLNKRNNTSRTQNAFANQMMANVRKLNLNFNNYFPNLKMLKIRSFLTNYDKDNAYFVKEMLTGLSSLETFEFNKNIIYVLPSQMFSTLTKLRNLYLNHNQIQQLERDALVNLKMLETLELDTNDLKELNEDVFRSLISLKQIKLKRNKFQQLPDRLFSKNRNLIEIDLSQNRELNSLPDHLLKNLNQLRNLSVFDCQLTQISPNPSVFFSNAPALKMIYMRNNRLKYLNVRNLFALNNELVKLDLAYNDITYLSPDIFSTNSSSLVELNLYANNLIEVPSNLFTNLKNLKILNLGFNNLTEIDVGIFFSLKNLEELDLSKNLLTTINTKRYALPFGIGTFLRTVNLAHNKLTSFANEFGVINWSLYLMLSELNLSNNLLHGDLMLPVFYSPKMKLDLRANQLTTILINEIELNERTSIDFRSTKDDVSKSKTQVSVYLAHNPINCDCRLFGFVNYTRSSNAKYSNLIEKVSFDTEYLECAQPEKLSRTLIEQLNDADLSCSINDGKVCPDPCNCQYISKYHQVDVDCQQKALQKPSNKVLLMSNYEDIVLEGDQRLSNKQIDLITLRFQHNKIRNLDTFNSLLFKNNTIKRRSTPIQLDLYLDNNTIEAINENFFNLTFNSIIASSISAAQTSANATNKNRKPNNQPQHIYLRTLSLTNNKLEYVPVDFLNRLVKLTASESKQPLPQFKLYLSSNPFNCTPVQQPLIKRPTESDDKLISDECYVKDMKNWLTKNYNYVGDLGDIYCFDSQNKNNSKQLIQYTDDQLCPLEIEDKSTTLLLLYICISMTVILLIITIFYFKNRQTILAFIYIHVHPVFVMCSFNEEDLDKEKLYDAFVSYSSQDRDVVMQLIEHLEKPSKQTNNSINYLQSRNGLPTVHEANADKIVPDMSTSQNESSSVNGLKGATSLKSNNSNLNTLNSSANDSFNLNSTLQNSNTIDEDSNYFKLCIHERDWLPGQLISWNIINSVRNSRRTILVLSKSFIQSIWFQIEFHTAYYQMLEDKMDRLIVIVKGDLPDKEHLDKDLAFLLSTKTYLVWGERYFWEKLKYSLPHKRAFKEDNKSMKPLMNGSNNLKLQDFGTYSTTPTGLHSLTNNRNTLYSNNKLSGKAKYMEECINNAISDYYKLDKKTSTPNTSTDAETTGKKDGYDLERKMKSNLFNKANDADKKYSGHLNPSFENENENETET